ncbi:MAG: sensor histidine kinase, partial [Lachnospiraceae bacterium]|nr:sensor histidine kinase [Lachnospiraceae bacterium]
HIFERFYKAGNSSVNSVGIGLAMAKQIVGNLGGSITVSSELGKGSDFEIKLYS